MRNLAQIRDKISQTIRVDYANLTIHHKLKAIMDQAPQLEPYDYNSLIRVIKSWFVNNNFTYSQLDRWIEKDINFKFSSTSVQVRGDKHAWDLKYNSGVCSNLALKCKTMIEILYPWANPVIVEKKSWNGGNGNHYFLLLPTKGLKYNDNYIETNSFFVDYQTRYELPYGCLGYDFMGDVYYIDPTRSVVGLRKDNPLYQIDLLTEYFIKVDCTMETKVINQSLDRSHGKCNYFYVHRFSNEEFGSLLLGYNNELCQNELVWSCRNYLYNFECQTLVDIISNIDYEAATKIRILQNRGIQRE